MSNKSLIAYEPGTVQKPYPYPRVDEIVEGVVTEIHEPVQINASPCMFLVVMLIVFFLCVAAIPFIAPVIRKILGLE